MTPHGGGLRARALLLLNHYYTGEEYAGNQHTFLLVGSSETTREALIDMSDQTKI